MKKPIRWIHGEIAAWEQAGLVSPEQAGRLRERYPEPPASNIGMILFASLGAVIVGLGVILLLAHNWQAIPRGGKLALILGSLLAAHGAGMWQIRAGRRGLGEGLNLLGTMLFGAGIWLIAQIYHIDEHYPNAFLFWSLGAMGLAWALPSVPQAALACVLIPVWCGVEGFDFSRGMHAGPLILAGWVATLAFRLRSAFLLTVAIPAFFLSLLFVLFNLPCPAHAHGGLIFSVLLNFGVALIAATYLWPRGGGFEAAPTILGFYGRFLALGLIYLLTFPHFADDVLPSAWNQAAFSVKLYTVVFAALAAALWLKVAVAGRRGQTEAPPGDEWLFPLAAAWAALHLFLPVIHADEWLTALPFNLILLALIVALMTRGCRQGLRGPTAVGSILLVLLMLARYFDLFESLWMRGLVFIGVGVALFVQGLIYRRVRRTRLEGGPR